MSLNSDDIPSAAEITGETPPAALRKEGKTSTLMLRGSVLQIVAFGCNLVASFFIMPLLIHALGERQYGLWALIGTIVGQLGILDAGLMTTTERFMANAIAKDDRETGTAIYSTSIAIFVVLGTLVFLSVAAISFATPLWLHDPREIRLFEIALLISGLNLAWLFPFAVMQGALAAAFRSDAATVAQVACTIVRTALTVAAILFGYGLVAVALAAFAGSFVQRVMMGSMMARYLPGIRFHRAAVSWKTVRELVAYGRFIMVVKMTDAARYRIHNLLIAPLAGIVAVTHYTVAVRLSDYFQAMVVRISSVSQPVYSKHFTRGEDTELRQKFLTISRLGSVICCAFAATTVVFGRSFVRLWLGKGFDDSYYALSILIVGMFFALLQSPARDVLRVLYKHQFDAKTNGIEVAINLILTVILIPIWGIVGAAIGMVVPMMVVKAIVMPIYVCRTIEMKLWTYYRTVGVPIVLSTLASAIVCVAVPLQVVSSLAVLMPAAVLFMIALLILLFYALPTGDKLTLVRALGRARIERLPGGHILLRSLGV